MMTTPAKIIGIDRAHGDDQEVQVEAQMQKGGAMRIVRILRVIRGGRR